MNQTASTPDDKALLALWAYLVKKCKPLADNNRTARAIYNRVTHPRKKELASHPLHWDNPKFTAAKTVYRARVGVGPTAVLRVGK